MILTMECARDLGDINFVMSIDLSGVNMCRRRGHHGSIDSFVALTPCAASVWTLNA